MFRCKLVCSLLSYETDVTMMSSYIWCITLSFVIAFVNAQQDPPGVFFPYGPAEGDTLLLPFKIYSDEITFSFPFFGNTYTKLFVNVGGVISFGFKLTDFDPMPFPLNSEDRRLIAPFWEYVNTNFGGYISYRQIQRNGNEGTFTEADDLIKQEFADLEEISSYESTRMFIATWDEVASFTFPGFIPPPRNSFQAVLVTDGSLSFTIFNYGNITWTTAEFGGSTTVGLNAGDGINYYSVPASGTADIVDIETTSNIDVPGRWLFRTDSLMVQGAMECTYVDINACVAADVCENGECVESTGCVYCICNAGFLGNEDNTACEALIMVDCGSSGMVVTIDHRLVPEGTSYLHFQEFVESSCKVEATPSEGSCILTAEYDQCGTEVEESDETVNYTNRITYDTSPGPDSDGVITRTYHRQFLVQCVLDKTQILTGSFTPHRGKVAFSEKSTGDFDLSLVRLTDQSLANEDEADDVVWLNQELFFGIRLQALSSVGMFINDCWATPTADHDSTATDPRHELITTGCPADESVEIYGQDVNGLVEPDNQRFSFAAFSFIGTYGKVYIHCSVRVCDVDKAISTRNEQCGDDGGTDINARKRRSASSFSTHTLSSDPIWVRSKTNDMATGDSSSYNPFGMLLLGIVATVVAIATLVGVDKLLKRSNVNYQPVPMSAKGEI